MILLASFAWLLTLPTASNAQAELSAPVAGIGEEMALFLEIPSVSGASKFEQKINEAPSSITIVTSAEIKKYGYRSLGDVLRSAPGVFTTYDRNYTYIGIRGFSRPGDYNTRILLLVDGHRINNNAYDEAPLGSDFPVDIDLIDRVEIIKGPSSSIYGTSAFFGVVNVITKRGRDLKGVELSAEAGSYDAYKGRTSYGSKFENGLEMLLSGSYYDSKGQDLYFKEFDSPRTNYGVANGCDDDRFHSLFSKWRLSDFSLEAAYHSREKGIPTAPWGTVFNDPSNNSTDEWAYVDIQYDHKGVDWGVLAHAYYDHYNYFGNYAYDAVDPPDPDRRIDNEDRTLTDRVGGDIQITKKLFDKHKALFGAEIVGNPSIVQENYDEAPYAHHLDDSRSLYNWAVFAQDEFRISANLILNAGIRYDYYSTSGGSLSPRTALVYNPFPETALKLLYGRAFRAPNAYELFYGDGETQKQARELDPESVTTYEVVIEQYVSRQLRAGISAYYYLIDDLITQKTDPADGLLVFDNSGGIEAKGLEAELSAWLPRGIEGRVSYALQEAAHSDTGKKLTNSPQNILTTNLSIPLREDKIFASARLSYMSPRLTLSGHKADDPCVVDLTLFSKSLIDNLEISGSLYNVFDNDYGDPGSGEHLQDLIPQDGRTFRIKITYSF